MVLRDGGKPAIEAVLAEAGAAKLKELAKNYYVKGYSKLNKPALVQAVSAALREPGRMEELLYIIDQPAFLLFKRAAKSREPVKVKKALPVQSVGRSGLSRLRRFSRGHHGDGSRRDQRSVSPTGAGGLPGAKGAL